MKQLAQTTLPVLAALVLWGAGCGTSKPPPLEEQPITCATLADCAAGQVCDGGICKPAEDVPGGGSCSYDSDCLASQYCTSSGACAERSNTDTSGCSEHSDCAFGLFCNLASGACVECLNDDACAMGEVCRTDGSCGSEELGCTADSCGNLVCESVSGNCVQCLTSGDCPAGQTCRDHACYPDSSTGGNPICTSQAECDPYGKVCNTLTGECNDCTSDFDCGTDRVCQAGTCTVDPATDPGGGDLPGFDGYCFGPADCGGQGCMPLLGTCMPCIADFMCEDLFGGSALICDVMSGNCIVPECTSAYDCPAGQGCYEGGHCGGCLYDNECRTGEICDTASETCITDPGGGTDPIDPPVDTCTTNADCSGGLICYGGSCDNCVGDWECDTGYICNASDLCEPDGGGTDPVDPIDPTGPSALGGTCAGDGDCDTGLSCITDATGGFCTRTCIGSGLGGDADCPIGYACYNFEGGGLDGVQLCYPAAELDATTPGQPFNLAPGASCAAANGCQTSVCYDDSQECARGCLANRDCASGEVCYATWGTTGFLGYHFCFGSDVSAYTPAGGSCSDGVECDSGICQGSCTDGSACNNSGECTDGSTCAGTCEDHCRTNLDCAATDACTPWPMVIDSVNGYSSWVPICMAKFYSGTAAPGAACTADSECSTDWCVGGICTTMCGIEADCSALTGTSCSPINFVDSVGDPVYAGSFCMPR